jgi:hypothetical protein
MRPHRLVRTRRVPGADRIEDRVVLLDDPSTTAWNAGHRVPREQRPEGVDELGEPGPATVAVDTRMELVIELHQQLRIARCPGIFQPGLGG